MAFDTVSPHWLDHAWSRWAMGPLFFSHGWGDEDVVPRLEARAAAFGPPAPAALTWVDAPRRIAGGTARRGTFPTPFAHELLPPESRTAWVEVLTPDVRWGEAATPPMVVHLAGVGDEGYRLRRFLSRPLLARGIGAVILENPYYGQRRPAGQVGISLGRVTDQFVMNLAAVEEALALLAWLRAGGHVAGVAGYSQGGYTAALVAAFDPVGVAAAPCAVGISAAGIFTEGLLARSIDWARLAEGGALEPARARLAGLLEKASLDRLRRPLRPDAAVLVGARHDGYVNPRSVEALARHWAGSDLHWVAGGHVSTVVLRRRALARAVALSVERLAAPRAPAKVSSGGVASPVAAG